LRQLPIWGIEPRKKEILPNGAARAILYPEKGFSKEKWPLANFLELKDLLEKAGVNVRLMRPPEVLVADRASFFFEDLAEVKRFFSEGGVFVSNDSGMAHLAGACGLATITIFTGFDPAIWHPRGRNIPLKAGVDRIDVESLAAMIVGIMEGGNGKSEGSS
jgi:ADP-heptose:LPS heptosyltransferase